MRLQHGYIVEVAGSLGFGRTVNMAKAAALEIYRKILNGEKVSVSANADAEEVSA
jgi:hypothetical protein